VKRDQIRDSIRKLPADVDPVVAADVTAMIWSETPNNTVSAVQANVTVDSRKASWFEVSVAKIAGGTIAGYTSFRHDCTDDDGLGLGRCSAPDLPTWLVKVAKQLRVTWDPPHISSRCRGTKRDQIVRWLLPGTSRM